jgi:hypothetical protein
MDAEHYLMLLRAAARAQPAKAETLLLHFAQQLAEADAVRAQLRERCQHHCCHHALPGHRPPLSRGADGRPDYDDYTY